MDFSRKYRPKLHKTTFPHTKEHSMWNTLFNPENEEDRKTLYKFIALFTFYILIVLIYFTYREYHYRQHLNKLNKEVNQAIYGENYEELHLTYFDNSSKWYRRYFCCCCCSSGLGRHNDTDQNDRPSIRLSHTCNNSLIAVEDREGLHSNRLAPSNNIPFLLRKFCRLKYGKIKKKVSIVKRKTLNQEPLMYEDDSANSIYQVEIGQCYSDNENDLPEAQHSTVDISASSGTIGNTLATSVFKDSVFQASSPNESVFFPDYISQDSRANSINYKTDNMTTNKLGSFISLLSGFSSGSEYCRKLQNFVLL